MSRGTHVYVFILLLASSNPLRSQPASNPDSVLQSILRALPGAPLLRQQAVDLAFKNSPAVSRAQASVQEAGGTVRREAGAFDPELFFALNHLDQKLPTASFFAGAPILATQQTSSKSGLRMKLQTGTMVELSLNTTRLGTNSTFAFLNPEHDVYGSLSVRQPLLRGLWVSARKDLSRTERELDAGKARYDQEVLAVSAEAERMYWDLYAAVRDYAIQKLTRDRASTFLAETQLRSRTGLIGPNQVANARTFLAQQELLLIEREEQLDHRSDLLAAMLGTRPEHGAPRFKPVDDPPADYPAADVDRLVSTALDRNLSLQADKNAIDAADISAQAAGWEALPQLDLVGSLGGSGLAGSNQTVVFGTDTLRISSGGGGFTDAVNQVSRRKFPNWNVGLEVSIPIGLRSGRGERERLEAQVLGAQQSYLEHARVLEEQVRTAYRELSHGKNRIEAARAGVDAAQEQVRIGLIEFRTGRLTAFELVRLGEDYAVAQQQYSGALVRTAKAAATLRELTSGGYPPSISETEGQSP